MEHLQRIKRNILRTLEILEKSDETNVDLMTRGEKHAYTISLMWIDAEIKLAENEKINDHVENRRSYWTAENNSADRILKETIKKSKENLNQRSFLEWLNGFVE